MKFFEKKGYCSFVMALYLVGMLCFAMSLFLSRLLPDFWLGFAEGIAIAGIVMGMIHIVFCFVRGRNPFTGQPS